MEKLIGITKEIRALTAECISSIGAGHIGGSLSIVDVLTVLYYKVMNIDPKNPKKEVKHKEGTFQSQSNVNINGEKSPIKGDSVVTIRETDHINIKTKNGDHQCNSKIKTTTQINGKITSISETQQVEVNGNLSDSLVKEIRKTGDKTFEKTKEKQKIAVVEKQVEKGVLEPGE
jgi:hypothetical protein